MRQKSEKACSPTSITATIDHVPAAHHAICSCNEHRPHMSLGSQPPNEVYFDRPPANEKPRREPRPKWPSHAPCAQPQASVNDGLRTRIALELSFDEGREHLPVIRLMRAA